MKIQYNINIKQKTKNFIENFLSNYDTSRLEKIVFKESTRGCVTGVCRYPYNLTKRKKAKGYTKGKRYYDIICRIGDRMGYPYREYTYVGCKINVATNGIKYMTWLHDEEYFDNRDQALIFVFGHEIFHFLRRTRQVEGKNTQSQANKFGFKLLREFKEVL